MEKLLDISGSISNGEFFEDDYLIGRIILKEDNSFEGAAEKMFTNDYYFIFGNLNAEEIDFIIGNDELTEVPKRIHAFKDEESFAGPVTAKDIYVEVPFGDCNIRINPADQTRELSDYEMVALKNSIKFQKSVIGERTQALYNAYKEKDNKSKKIGQK